MELECTMMKAKNLPNVFWVAKISNFIYLLIRSPLKSVQNGIPYEAWNGRRHNVVHFKIYGWIAYAHILEETRKILNAKSDKCIFVGYNEETKGYKSYNPIPKNFLISCDVFYECEAWYDDNKLQ